MKALYCTVLCYLARDGSSKVVNAKTNVGREDKSGGGGDGVGVSSIGGSIRVSSISSVQESRVSLSFTLAIVVSVRVSSITISIRSIALGGGIKSLGEGVKTSAGAERDSSSISTVQESGISLGVSITLAVVDKSVPSSTRDRDVCSVHTRGALETNTIGKGKTSITSISSVQQGWVSLGRDGGHEGGCYNQKFHDDDTALIFQIQLITAGLGQPRQRWR